MQKYYKISVIVPMYNVEKYITKCAQSLFEQTLDNIEYIFVDDGSTDSTITVLKNILERYPNKKNCVRIVQHDKNKGVSSARNTGLKYAQGAYIYYCDADDYLERNMLEQLYNTANRTDADMVWCDFYMDFKDDTKYCSAITAGNDKITLLKKYISYGWNVVWNTLVKRNIYIDNNLHSYKEYNFCEDYGLMVRAMFFANSYAYVKQALYHYNHANTNSLVNTQLNKNEIKKTFYDELAINLLIVDFFKQHNLYPKLEKELSWRILKAKRGYLTSFKNRKTYMQLCPESNKYIDSNPLCSKKDKFCQKIMISKYWSWLLNIIDFTVSIKKYFTNKKI